MSITHTQSIPVRTQKPERNDPCWCGSGKKYKKCHLIADAQADTPGFSSLTPRQPDADKTFDDLCVAYEIPLNAEIIIEWNTTRKTREFDLTYFIELFAAFAPGNNELHRLVNLMFHIMRNHPGKPDPNVAPNDPDRISEHAFDIPNIDQQTTFGKVNKAFALTKMQAYEKAMDIYALVLSNINEIEEPFRVYLNIGVCLISCGQMELGKKYFEKSLASKPDYSIARNNIHLFTNPILVAQQRTVGRSRLLDRALQTHTWLDTIDIHSCGLVDDIHIFLTYIANYTVSVTEKLRMITLRDAQHINQLFAHPNSGRATDQWQYKKLSWIYVLCNQAGLLRVQKSRLRLSRLAKKIFLDEPAPRRLAWLLETWINHADWRMFLPPGWTYEFDEDLMIKTQALVGPFLSFMAGSTNPFTAHDGLTAIEIQPVDAPAKTPEEKNKDNVASMIMQGRIEHHIFEPLVWMNMLITKNRTFMVTSFGHTVLDGLFAHSNTCIPNILTSWIHATHKA